MYTNLPTSQGYILHIYNISQPNFAVFPILITSFRKYPLLFPVKNFSKAQVVHSSFSVALLDAQSRFFHTNGLVAQRVAFIKVAW